MTLKQIIKKLAGNRVMKSNKLIYQFICCGCKKIRYIDVIDRGRYCSRQCFTKSAVGENNPQWEGGSIWANGYRVLTIGGVRIGEHRLIMEKHIGRKLGRKEIVHHINHDRLDNRIENLQVMSASKHSSMHAYQMAVKGKEGFQKIIH